MMLILVAFKKGAFLRTLKCQLSSNVIKNSLKLLNRKSFSVLRTVPKINVPKSILLWSNVGLSIGCGLAFNCLKADCEQRKIEKQNHVAENDGQKPFPDFKWSKFFQLLKPYWLGLLSAITAALACALLNILIPKVLGNLIDVLAQVARNDNNFMDDLKKPATTMLFYYTLHSIFTFCYISLLSQIAEGIAKTVKTQSISSIMAQDVAFFDKHRTGELVNRLTLDVHDFKSSFKTVVSQGLRSSAQIIGCSITLLQISPQMTGIMMLVVPTVILIGSFVGSILRQISFHAKSQNARVVLAAEEAISNIRTVRSFAMEDIEKKKFEEEVGKASTLEIRLGLGIAAFQAGTNLFLNGMILSTIYIGGCMLRTGSITAGDLMAFLVAVQILQRSFSQLSILFGTYLKGLHSGARVFEIIDTPGGMPLKTGKIIPYHAFIPEIQLRNVDFAYPNRPDQLILKNVTLEIPANSTVAIVGPSGSGKSTIAWLVERLYDVNKGSIVIGGEDIRDLNASWLRGRVIGFISQEPLLFATTVMENIRYGKPDASDKEVIEAAKLANADGFIRKFPDSYNTLVGERGVALSGGQKQRIAIARALLKNPLILILDEATSALDAESEKQVQNALDKVMKSRTTIVIAHRLSTIMNADVIVVLRNGVIVEMGTHQELMKKRKVYAALVEQQTSSSS